MNNFTGSVELEGANYVLHFSIIHTAQAQKFFVHAGIKDEKPAHFEIKKDAYGKWKIVLPVANVFALHEEKIIDLAERNLTNFI